MQVVVLDMLEDMQSWVSHTNTTFRGEEACQPVCFFFRERKTFAEAFWALSYLWPEVGQCPSISQPITGKGKELHESFELNGIFPVEFLDGRKGWTPEQNFVDTAE